MLIMSRTALIVSDANISAVCRLCMIYHEYYVNIFTPNDSFGICAEEAIHDLLSLKVAEGDGLPSNVCHQCVKKLIEFRDFKEMCLKSAMEQRKSDFGNVFSSMKEESEEPKKISGGGNSLNDLSPLNHIKVTEVFIPVPDQISIKIECHGEENLRATVLADKEEVSDGVDCTDGDIPVTSLSSLNLDPLAVDTMSPVKDECVPMPLPSEVATGNRSDSVDFEFRLPVVPSDLPLDPLALDDQADSKEVYTRGPFGESDDSGEYIAEKACSKDAAVCTELNQFLFGEQSPLEGYGVTLQLMDEKGRCIVNMEDECPVLNEACDPLAFDNLSPVKDECVPMRLPSEVASGNRSDSVDFEFQLSVVPSDLPLDPLALDDQADSKYVYTRDPFGESDDSGEDIAEKASSEDAAVCSEINQFVFGEQGEVKNELELMGKGESQRNEIFDEGDSSVTGSLLSHRVAVVNTVDRCINIGEITEDPGYNFDKFGPQRKDLSQNRLLNDSCLAPTHEGNLQFEYSMAKSIVINGFPKKNQTKKFKPSTSIKKSSQLNNRSKTVNCHERMQLCHDVANTICPAEYICDYCGEKYSEMRPFALHIKGHVDGNMSVIVLPMKEVPRGVSPNPLGKKRRNVEKVIPETRYVSTQPKNSLKKNKNKYEKRTSEVSFECEKFGREFNDSETLLTHKVTPWDRVTFVCDACGREFPKKCDLVKHVEIHAQLNQFKCHICGKKFKSKCVLMRHQTLHTDVKEFKCAQCGKQFIAKHYLQRHSETHTDLKPFKCDFCGKCFKYRGDLKKHSGIHTGVKSYKCGVCGKMFGRNGSLQRHSVIHSGLKQFKCNECGKNFAEKGTLKRHVSVHTGLKPFECTQCRKVFTQSRDLKRHSVSHTKVKPFKCNLCGKEYKCSKSFNGHLLLHAELKPLK